MGVQVMSVVGSAQDSSGPCRHIRQPVLRVFWAKHFDKDSEVPWDAFWDYFPAGGRPGACAVHVPGRVHTDTLSCACKLLALRLERTLYVSLVADLHGP